uniref:DNA-binding protein Hu-like protein n=1 Tax=Sciadococcus taiwanensis TaxID=3028030 RepID=A0A9Y1MWH4_9RHOD|nr:DNA-binding protein Hu-like protein [Sciadococcus taiwanensis]
MNKGELVDIVARKVSITKKEADAIISATLDTIVDTVSIGNKVTLVGFGAFEAKQRKAREGRNPKTGKKMQIPSTRIPSFSVGKIFKEKVSHNSESK